MQPEQTRDPARRKAALIHLVASIAVVGGVLAVPYLLWYPGALRPLSGIDRDLLSLFAAVLIVGPALTSLVYRTGKRTLRVDIAVVVMIQLLFLGYASAMLARLRPVYLVGMHNHMELVRAVDIDREDLAALRVEPRSLSWTGPALVGALPGGPALFGANDYARRPAHYIDYEKVGPVLAQRGRPVNNDEIMGVSADPANLRMVRLVSAAGQATMLVDSKDGRPIGATATTF